MSATGPCDKCGTPNAILAPHTGKRLCDPCFYGLLAEPPRRFVNVGDPVIYHRGKDGVSVFGVVKAIAAHDGDCDIDLGDQPAALDVKMGQGPHTYEPLDFTPDWSIVYCPNDQHRWPSFFEACPHCGTALSPKTAGDLS